MKKLLIFINIFIISLSCINKSKSQINKKNDMNTMYYLNYNLSFPYEILINDVLLEKDVFNGRSGPDRLNNYILNSGKQKIKIRIFAPENYNNGLLKNKDLQILGEQTALYKVDADNKSFNIVEKMPFSTILKDLPFYEQDWYFDAEIPFEIKGWKNSKDLTKIDKDELLQKVQKKFQELYNDLNEGNTDNFLQEIKNSNDEFFISNYFNEKQKNDYKNNLVKSYSNFKGKMIPITSSTLRIMDGKTVTLEISEGKYKGMGVLIAEDLKKQNIYFNTIILHIPFDSNELKVIRINSVGEKLSES